MKVLLSIYIILISSLLTAQVEVDKPLIFSGENNDNKKVKNISSSFDYFQLSKAEEVQKGNYKFIEIEGGDLLEVNFGIELDEYIQGMMLTLKVNNSNSAAVQVRINQLDPVPVLKKVTQELAPNDILSGQIIQLIFDGENFQLMSKKGKKCPDGFVDGNGGYCIETSARQAALFYDAAAICNEMNARICSWGEWFYACNNPEIEFNPTAGWEWTNSNSITKVNAKTVGASNSCYTNTSRNTQPSANETLQFRCCYEY